MFCVKTEILIFTDHVSQEGKTIGSTCPFVSNLSLETEGPMNLNFCQVYWVITLAHLGLEVKVIDQSRRIGLSSDIAVSH